MARSRLPRRLEELNADWLRELMRESSLDPGPILEVGFERIGAGQGMMGEVGRVRWLTRESTRPNTLIAKLPALHRGNRAQGELLGLYEREVRFYRELAPSVGYRTAKHLGSILAPRPEPDPEAGAKLGRLPDFLIRWLAGLGLFLSGRIYRGAVLLLEDLAPAEVGDQLERMGPERLRSVLTAIAQGQAASWDRPELERLPWLPRVDSAPDLLRVFYRRARPSFLQSFRSKVSEEVLALADRANDLVTGITSTLAEGPRTLLHGDLRVDNLFFAGPGPEDVIFTDWQVPAVGKGAYDLAYFLTGTLESEVTAETEEHWVGVYHAALVEAGVSNYDLDSCWADYRVAALQMLPRVFTASATVDFTNPRGAQLQQDWLDRLLARISAQSIASWHQVLDRVAARPGI